MEEMEIIERKTPIPGEFDQYVWVDGALTLLQDYRDQFPIPIKRMEPPPRHLFENLVRNMG